MELVSDIQKPEPSAEVKEAMGVSPEYPIACRRRSLQSAGPAHRALVVSELQLQSHAPSPPVFAVARVAHGHEPARNPTALVPLALAPQAAHSFSRGSQLPRKTLFLA